MIIWLLALVLIASVAALGYRQGAVRVAIAFLGILAGALLAVPLGRFVEKGLTAVGLKDPLWIWALGPIIVFILISAAFKVGGFNAHQKIDVYYKYRAGDLRLALWERLNHRLGLALGVLNGVAYAVLLAFVIYVPGYAAVQFQTSDQDPKWLRLLASIGEGLHATGMDKVARAIDRMPEVNYKMVDLAAVIYRNPLLEARLASYPAFLSLAETAEFADASNDTTFLSPWQRQVPIMTLLEVQRIVAIRSNPGLLKMIWNTVEPDIDDLRSYLSSGRSAKYDPIKILGRWRFNVSAGVAAIRRTRPNMSSREMQNLRRIMDAAFGKTLLVARPDHSVSLKNAPGLKLSAVAAGGTAPQNMQGQWKDLDGKYQLSLSGNDVMATAEGDRLAIRSENMDLVFNRED